VLTDTDLYLFHEGRHFRLHEHLGVHPVEDGAWAAVWAPRASAVSVISDSNGWNPDAEPLRRLSDGEVWAGVVSSLRPGDRYKFRLGTDAGDLEKADPFAAGTEAPPQTASVVTDLSYRWGDAEWMDARRGLDHDRAPLSVYEVHLASWRRAPDGRTLGYREIADALADHVSELGFTHVELLPVMEHPFGGSWGYQTTSYFAPTARFGSPTDLMAMVDHLHQRGIGVLLDWVPAHFPADEHALARFDGAPLFEDPAFGLHPDWSTLSFDYERPEVRAFLISSAACWLDRYHADGLRVDAVASMLYRNYSRAPGEWQPNIYGGHENLGALQLLRELNAEVERSFPGAQVVAEESTAWPGVTSSPADGGLGFTLKWDMGWMHDSLEYFEHEAVHRRFHHDQLTFRAVYANTERFILPLSHDEVVHGKGSLLNKMPGDDWQRFANLRLLLGWQFAQPGKQLLFMGTELAPWREWDHDGELEWGLLELPTHAGVCRWIGDLNRLHQRERALHEGDFEADGFEWVIGDDRDQSVFAFIRRAPGARPVLAVANATPVPRPNYRVGVPSAGAWAELVNGDAEVYGGSGVGNLGCVDAVPVPAHGSEWSIALSLPPLALVMLAPDPR
jgi:1,4-alpha-glucan branching enzyme